MKLVGSQADVHGRRVQRHIRQAIMPGWLALTPSLVIHYGNLGLKCCSYGKLDLHNILMRSRQSLAVDINNQLGVIMKISKKCQRNF